MVSNARDDLPEPESPVKTMRESRGRSSETFLRLCSRAPRTVSRSATPVRTFRGENEGAAPPVQPSPGRLPTFVSRLSNVQEIWLRRFGVLVSGVSLRAYSTYIRLPADGCQVHSTE